MANFAYGMLALVFGVGAAGAIWHNKVHGNFDSKGGKLLIGIFVLICYAFLMGAAEQTFNPGDGVDGIMSIFFYIGLAFYIGLFFKYAFEYDAQEAARERADREQALGLNVQVEEIEGQPDGVSGRNLDRELQHNRRLGDYMLPLASQ